DGLYTLSVRSKDGESLRVIGAISRIIVAPEAVDDLLRIMSDARTRIVSLTVTEKGYCHDPATGSLNEKHPDIVHDRAEPRRPRSAPGLIVEALRRRREAGLAPFAVLTCDNLPSNGRTVKRVLARYAELVDPDLGLFVAKNVSCPATMVDRIVPATTDGDRARISQAIGVTDAWPVVTEP
ncbi:mannitol dehydrogenase family protein, partial [Corallococcus exiguus]|nr:mannitol dehydrogenase family protein [Corallococcus exiguus]